MTTRSATLPMRTAGTPTAPEYYGGVAAGTLEHRCGGCYGFSPGKADNSHGPFGPASVSTYPRQLTQCNGNFRSTPHATRFLPGAVGTGRELVTGENYSFAESDFTDQGHYSCADVSDVLAFDGKTPVSRAAGAMFQNSVCAGWRTPLDNQPGTTPGVCSLVDASDLCNEIDTLFFSSMRTSNC